MIFTWTKWGFFTMILVYSKVFAIPTWNWDDMEVYDQFCDRCCSLKKSGWFFMYKRGRAHSQTHKRGNLRAILIPSMMSNKGYKDPRFEMDLYDVHSIEYESPWFISLSPTDYQLRHSNCWIIWRGYPPTVKSWFLQVCWVRCSLFILILP